MIIVRVSAVQISLCSNIGLALAKYVPMVCIPRLGR